MPDMIQSHLEKPGYVRVVQGVVDVLALSARTDDLEVFQTPQLMRDRGNRKIESFREIAHASFGIQKRLDDFDPRGVAEGRKNRRDILELVGRRGLSSCPGGSGGRGGCPLFSPGPSAWVLCLFLCAAHC